MALTRLYSYLMNGGRLYIENPDLGYAHNGTPFWSLLGITYQSDGAASGNVSEVNGLSAWLGDGLAYGYPFGEAPDSYVDLWAPSGTGVGQFDDQQHRVKVIRNMEGARGYRTIASAVIFGALEEDVSMSTQVQYMGRIIAYLLGDDEIPPAPVSDITVGIDGNQVLLSWDFVCQDAQGGNESIDSYRIERNQSFEGR